MKHYVWVGLLASCLLLGGCVSQNIIDKIALVQSAAYDLGDNDKVEGSLGTTTYTTSKNGQVELYKTTAKTVKGVWSKLNGRTPKPLKDGQLKVTLIGKRLAKKGVDDIVYTVSRDPKLNSGMFYAVVDGKASDLLKRNYSASTLPSRYIADMLTHNIKSQSLPTTNHHYFNYHLQAHGSDPFLPLLKDYKNHIAIEGLALFDQDKYVGKINFADMFVFRRLFEDTSDGEYEMALKVHGKRRHISIKQITSSQSYDFKHMDTLPEVTIKVKMKGLVTEYVDGLNLRKQSSIDLVEKKLSKHFEGKAQHLIHRVQQKNIDPLAMGMRAEEQYRHLNISKWGDIYPRLNVNVKADVMILQTGARK